MCELPVYSTTCCAHECTETGANILWSQAVAIDTSFILGELEKTPYNSLVFLIFLDPVGHSPDVTGTQIQESIAQPPQQTTMPTMPKRGRRREREKEREKEKRKTKRGIEPAARRVCTRAPLEEFAERELERERDGSRVWWSLQLRASLSLSVSHNQSRFLSPSFPSEMLERERRDRERERE